MPDYSDIPSAETFQRDSAAPDRSRKDDRLLVTLDAQLHVYDRKHRNAEEAQRFAAVTELFMTCNAWIADAHARSASTIAQEEPAVAASGSNVVKKKLLKILHMGKAKPKADARPAGGPGTAKPVDRKQFQAVLALFGAIEQAMADLLGTQDRHKLKRDLVRLVGQQVDEAGVRTDERFDTHMIASASERQVHRLFFENGLIFRYNVDVRGVPSELAPLESSRFESREVRRRNHATGRMEAALPGFAPFVMSLDRQFYMQKHSVERGGVFHSTYLNGEPAAAAGTMLVEAGVLKAIRGDSGHYKPEPRQIANALRALQQQGVSLSGVKVIHFQDADQRQPANAAAKQPLFARTAPPSPVGSPAVPDQAGTPTSGPYARTPATADYARTPAATGNARTPPAYSFTDAAGNDYDSSTRPAAGSFTNAAGDVYDGAAPPPVEVSAQQWIATYG